MCADIKATLGGQPKGCPGCGGTGDAEAWAARIKAGWTTAGSSIDALLREVEALDEVAINGTREAFEAAVARMGQYAPLLCRVARTFIHGLRRIAYAEGDGPTRSWDEPHAADAARATLANADGLAEGKS
jgi:hypothetical protein